MPVDAPDSPPASPVIPKGLATTLGQIGTATLAACAALTAILPGNQSGETKLFATLATVVAVATIVGRMLQAAAALLSGNPGAQSPVVSRVQAFTGNTDVDELPTIPAHPGNVPADEGDKGRP